MITAERVDFGRALPGDSDRWCIHEGRVYLHQYGVGGWCDLSTWTIDQEGNVTPSVEGRGQGIEPGSEGYAHDFYRLSGWDARAAAEREGGEG